MQCCLYTPSEATPSEMRANPHTYLQSANRSLHDTHTGALNSDRNRERNPGLEGVLMGAAPFFSWAAGTQGDLRLDDGRAAAATPSPEVRRPRPSSPPVFSTCLPALGEGGPRRDPLLTAQRRSGRAARSRGEESRRSPRMCLTSRGRLRGDPPLPERKWTQNGQDE